MADDGRAAGFRGRSAGAGRGPGAGAGGSGGSAGSSRGSSSRASFAERRERKAEVDDPAVVLEAAARFLEARARSVAEVRRRLTGAGYQAVLVEGAITRMLELGMLDDEAFARAWIESRDRARPRGERAMRQELGLKGVDRATVDLVLSERREAVAGVPDEDGGSTSPDLVAAERLIARNARSLARIADPRQRRRRAYALLARNGFDPEVCRTVAARVMEADERSEED
ncbi:MAG: regulatory protein [Chloroflexota bacterium]|nr:regulatory protein [Chloroflexota bacterium]